MCMAAGFPTSFLEDAGTSRMPELQISTFIVLDFDGKEELR